MMEVGLLPSRVRRNARDEAGRFLLEFGGMTPAGHSPAWAQN